MGATSTVDGTTVTLASCGDVNTVEWSLPPQGADPHLLTGQISLVTDGTKCLDVRNGDPTNGNLLQIWKCSDVPNPNQRWQVARPQNLTTPVAVSWAGKNKCADVKDGAYAPGTNLQIWDCIPSNVNQLWSISPAL